MAEPGRVVLPDCREGYSYGVLYQGYRIMQRIQKKYEKNLFWRFSLHHEITGIAGHGRSIPVYRFVGTHSKKMN